MYKGQGVSRSQSQAAAEYMANKEVLQYQAKIIQIRDGKQTQGNTPSSAGHNEYD